MATLLGTTEELQAEVKRLEEYRDTLRHQLLNGAKCVGGVPDDYMRFYRSELRITEAELYALQCMGGADGFTHADAFRIIENSQY